MTNHAPPPIDWLRLLHRGLVLARSLRGDARTLEEDHQREGMRARQLNETIENMARSAVGCARVEGCDCPICEDHKEGRHR